jgi:uncharacterized Fe-S cluster protein YjdI
MEKSDLLVMKGFGYVKEYKNDHIIVYWFPELCAHPGICLRLLPEVFNLSQIPWINVNEAEPKDIINTIDKCPSGALRYSLPEGSKVDEQIASGVGNINFEKSNPATVKIRVNANGALFIEGQTVVIGHDGKLLKEGSKMALCRCGLSGNRPFCNGAHSKQGWKVDEV